MGRYIHLKKRIFFFLVTFWLTCLFVLTIRVNADETNVTVVIDPGHGGDNLGGQYGDYTEKDMTIVTANAMKNYLEQFEGVTVYLTHDSADTDMSLEDRVDFAAEHNADLLVCLHYNLSISHILYGSEIWVPSHGELYAKSYSAANIFMEQFEEMGLYNRGIKTRLNNVSEDYYGILRHANEHSINTVLVEHCHLDNVKDNDFYNSNEKQQLFGKLDAIAVAKYFGLTSSKLQESYEGYENLQVEIPNGTVVPDESEPDYCYGEIDEIEDDTGNLFYTINAEDYDSGILYYAYSLDGGDTFSDLKEWVKSSDKLSDCLTIPSGEKCSLVFRAYNGYDIYLDSEPIELPTIHYGEEIQSGTQAGIETQTGTISENDNQTDLSGTELSDAGEAETTDIKCDLKTMITVILAAFLLLVLGILLTCRIIIESKRKKRRRRKRRKKAVRREHSDQNKY